MWQVHKELRGLPVPVTHFKKPFYIQKVKDPEVRTIRSTDKGPAIVRMSPEEKKKEAF